MKVLIANRGEIACRIIAACEAKEIAYTLAVTPEDLQSLAAHQAKEIALLKENDAYLQPAALLEAAKFFACNALHPGYGFLSQHAAFAQRCLDEGIFFIGPTPHNMEILGDKRSSRLLAGQLQIPTPPGEVACDDISSAKIAAKKIGYPILLKAAGGGGGKGMRYVANEEQLHSAFERAQSESIKSFADPRLLLEKWITEARHIEVQMIGDGKRCIAISDRECSLQRRYQKVVEESPASCLSEALRQQLYDCAQRLSAACQYKSLGTVEFLVKEDGSFYFLEVNTRIQVEHPVSEAVLGLDLVSWQLELMQGSTLENWQLPATRGHAIEVRLNAENPAEQWLPSSGKIEQLFWPQQPGIRIDSGIQQGQQIGFLYDSLLAKIIAWGNNREQARKRLIVFLQHLRVLGIVTNQSFLIKILESDFFIQQQTYTTSLEEKHQALLSQKDIALDIAQWLLTEKSYLLKEILPRKNEQTAKGDSKPKHRHQLWYPISQSTETSRSF